MIPEITTAPAVNFQCVLNSSKKIFSWVCSNILAEFYSGRQIYKIETAIYRDKYEGNGEMLGV